ncbi:MAG: 6-pyruvoyl-tetrahydropterin synthase-related protein [Patescibacteria group bacterium]|nr:6-pyruvoyl-tetrahydropterin synthase-related protein [Patescibacteria group bacterium]
MKELIAKNWTVFVLCLLFSLIIWPLFLPGYFSHHDDLQVMRIFEMRRCFADLQLPCRWVPDMGYGNGFPLFNYYNPLAYYIGGVLSFALGFIGASKTLFFIPLVLGGISMYLLVRELSGNLSGLVAALLYSFAPYRALDFYVRGDIAEGFALALIPMVFYFILRLIRQKTTFNFLGTVIFWSTFLISHNIMVLLFIPPLLIWIVYWLAINRLRNLPAVSLSLILGFGLAAFFLIPAFVEKSLVQIDTLTQGDLNYRAHFITLNQLFFSRFWGYGASVLGPNDTISFQVGWPQWWVAAGSLVAIILRLLSLLNKKIIASVNRNQVILIMLLFSLFAGSLFMTHNKSAFIWEKISILSYVQFPWRFLSVAIFSSSILGGFLILVFKGKLRYLIAISIIFLTAILNWNFFRPEKFYPLMTDQEKLSGMQWATQQKASVMDYLPETAHKPKEIAADKPLVVSGRAEISDFINKSNQWQFQVTADQPTDIEVPVFDFPNWQVKVNGIEVPHSHQNQLGRISLNLEPGHYLVGGVFADTSWRRFSNIISIFSFIVLVFIYLYENLKKFLYKYSFVLIFVLSLPAVWALFVPGFFGASDDMHIAWLFEMDRAFKAGQFPPRYVPDLSFGFGYPLFNFVFPLPFYIAEIFHLINFSLVDSIKAVFFLSLLFSMFFMYKFLKEFTGNWLGVAGAVVYGFTPYRSTDVYVRGAFGEALSFVFLPLIALSVAKLTETFRTTHLTFNKRWLGIGGLSLAALILSHNITAYMFIPFVLLLAALRISFISINKLIAALQLIISALIGLLISIYFWLPALGDSPLMKYDTVFNFADHFPTLKQLLLPYWGYGASVPGPGDGMSFFIGTVNLVLLILGMIFMILFWRRYSRSQRILLLWALVSFLISFLMMNYRSIFIWNNVPLLPYFQFPWRFLTMTTFVTPIFIIGLTKVKYNFLVAATAVFLVIFLNYGFFRPHDFLGRMDDYYINRYVPIPKASSAYLQTTEEYLRLPLTTQKRPTQNYPMIFSTDEVTDKIMVINSLDISAEVSTNKEAIINYNKYFFPGWEAKIDGKKTVIKPGIPFGQISVSVPAGEHLLDISFNETLFKRVLDIISLVSLLTAILFSIKLKILRRVTN